MLLVNWDEVGKNFKTGSDDKFYVTNAPFIVLCMTLFLSSNIVKSLQ